MKYKMLLVMLLMLFLSTKSRAEWTPVLADNFNVVTAPNLDQNADLTIRQTGTKAPSAWVDLGTGNTQTGGVYDPCVAINASKQLQIFIPSLPNTMPDVIIPAQTTLPQMPHYRLTWDQGASAGGTTSDGWSLLQFNTVTSAGSHTYFPCGIMVWGPTSGCENKIAFWSKSTGSPVFQGIFPFPSGENGLHHFVVDVNEGLMNVYIDGDTSPTWTKDISDVGTGKTGVGVVSFFGVATNAYGYLDNFKYEINTPDKCGDMGTVYPIGDFTGPNGVRDCRVNLCDIAFFAADWLKCTDPADNTCYRWWE